MIRVKRYAPEEIGIDTKLIEKLKEETDSAIKYYDKEIAKAKNDEEHKIKAFSFAAYRDTKPDLIKIYNAKCAYCEVTVDTAQPGDVEHFRPKSAIDTRFKGIENLSNESIEPPKELSNIKPGYYWLAANWYNLLLSCNACNRFNTVLNASKNTGDILSEDTLVKETLGKGSRFPFVDVKKRNAKPNKDISEEKDLRLLIDPGEDDPRDHIQFIKHKGRKKTIADSSRVEVEEKFGMVKATTDKGLASIQIFGLARYKLVLLREKEAHELMRDLADLKQSVNGYIGASEALKASPGNTFIEESRDRSMEAIKVKMEDLNNQFRNSSIEESPSQFLGMKRTMVRNWIDEENKVLTDLKQLGVNVEELLVLDVLKELNFIRRLTLNYNDADKNGNAQLKGDKVKVITKVWEALQEEVSTGSSLIAPKKSLIEGWVDFMEEDDDDKKVIQKLKELGFDMRKLIGS